MLYTFYIFIKEIERLTNKVMYFSSSRPTFTLPSAKKKMIECNKSKHQNNILDHVILPRVLPQRKSSYTHEQTLVDQMVENVENLSEFLPQKTVNMMKYLKRINHECTPPIILELINGLCPGDTFSMFVRNQNTAIIFHAPKSTGLNDTGKPDNIIVATFPGCLHPRTIYEHDSDIEVNGFNDLFFVRKSVIHFQLIFDLI